MKDLIRRLYLKWQKVSNSKKAKNVNLYNAILYNSAVDFELAIEHMPKPITIALGSEFSMPMLLEIISKHRNDMLQILIKKSPETLNPNGNDSYIQRVLYESASFAGNTIALDMLLDYYSRTKQFYTLHIHDTLAYILSCDRADFLPVVQTFLKYDIQLSTCDNLNFIRVDFKSGPRDEINRLLVSHGAWPHHCHPDGPFFVSCFGEPGTMSHWPEHISLENKIILMERHLKALKVSPLDFLTECPDEHKDAVLAIMSK